MKLGLLSLSATLPAFGALAAVVAACSSSTPTASAVRAEPIGDAGAALRFPAFGPLTTLAPPSDDPPTKAKAALGRALFYDARLSGSGGTSCDSCHVHDEYFQDALTRPSPDRSAPSDSPVVARNTTSLLNLAYGSVFRWDGSAATLVDALTLPFAEPNMNIARFPRGSRAVDVVASQIALRRRVVDEIPGYAARFASAFDVDPRDLTPERTWELTGRALRAFLAPAVAGDAPFDRWNAGDDGAIDDAAKRGFDLFRGRARCASCHTGPRFTDESFHNVSSSPPGPDGARPDEGRWLVTHAARDRGAFLTPTLRQAYDTSPYFHDGGRASLSDVLHFFSSRAVLADPLHDVGLDPPIALDDGDVADLVAFVKSLRGVPAGDLDPPAPGDLP